MGLRRQCFLLVAPFVLFGIAGGLNIMEAPLLLDYTQRLSIGPDGDWDISNLFHSYETPDTMKFDHHVKLNSDAKLEWNFSEGNITFKLSARTLGWIGIGIARTRSENAGADFVVAGYRTDGTYIKDMHIGEDGQYLVDKVQDTEGEYIWETVDETFAIFTRPLVTCDHSEDVDVTPDTLRIIWAYGENDIEGSIPKKDELHIAKQGWLNIKLLNPTIPALHMNTSDTGVKTLVVTAENVSVEQGEYRHCIAFRFPNTSTKGHIVQLEPILTPGNEHNVRQITIRECSGSKQGLSSNYQIDLSCESIDSISDCKTIVLKWAIGMSTFTFPDDTGFPINQSNAYYMMEILYSNPHIPGLIDSSGLKIYYTSQLRKHDAGVLTTGSLVHESQIIPPKSSKFLLQGHCMKKCIQLALPEDRHVTIFAALLHARETGRKIKIRHFRHGEELHPIAEDNQFHFSHQQTQHVNHKIHLKKGDNMIVECTYDTSDLNEITYVNNSKGGESCLAYISYYPRIAKLTACETAPIEKVIMDTVGAERPEEMTKIAEQFEWTAQKTREYNDELLTSQVYVHCGDVKLEDPQPVPKIDKVYVKHHKCKRPAGVYDTTTKPANPSRFGSEEATYSSEMTSGDNVKGMSSIVTMLDSEETRNSTETTTDDDNKGKPSVASSTTVCLVALFVSLNVILST